MQPLPISEREIIVNHVRSKIKEQYPQLTGYGSCVYTATFLSIELMKRGYRPVIQAGHAYWQMRDIVEDETVECHFGYQWSPHSLISAVAILEGRLPEVHVWVAIRETQEIIDLTSSSFPVAYKAMFGNDWEYTLPPDYLWVNKDEMPRNCHYVPTLEACEFVVKMINKEVLPEIIDKGH